MRTMIGALLLTLLLGGCAQFRSLQSRADVESGPDLKYLVRLSEAGEAELAHMGEGFDSPIDAETNPRRALRHAFWRGTPGHPGHDADAARQSLRELLDAGMSLTAEQRQLARLYLADLERRIRLRRTNAELSDANRKLREQIEALTDLESEMGGDTSDDE